MAAFPGGDKLQIIYEGPPRLENGVTVAGDKFYLAGDRAKQAREGVELARGLSGILRPMRDYRYDTSADQPGSTYVDSVANRRKIDSAINVFGDTPALFRENWRRWAKNNRPGVEGKLWFETSDAPKRYAFVRPSSEAGLSSMDIDPNIYGKIEGLSWGWESDYPFFFGETQQISFGAKGVAEFVNLSDVERTYPKIYLPGPGSFTLQLPDKSTLSTPTITEDEVIRFNFDPLRLTYVKRNMKTGEVQNLWYTLNGKRPKLVMKPGEKVKVSVNSSRAGTEPYPYVEYTPLYEGVM